MYFETTISIYYFVIIIEKCNAGRDGLFKVVQILFYGVKRRGVKS